MTDNEKAATFIGWKPFACGGNPPEWADEHANVAPDMSRPEHYMRAIERFEADGGFIGMQSDTGDWLRVVGAEPKRRAWCWLQTKKLAVQEYGDSLADSILRAFAALYDHEQLK